MKPKQSYRIWFSQRNGSTVLCKGLEDTGVAGKPGEFFNVAEDSSLCEKYAVGSFAALRDKIWELGTSPNGVFGIKHSLHAGRYGKIFEELKNLKGIPDDQSPDEEELLGDLFPNCRHIFLTRRNKVRQAVSWWKAIQDNVWHLEAEQEHRNQEDFYEKNYDFAALSHLFKEATLRECAIQEYFSRYHIQPLTLVYEDFIENFKGTIQRIVDYLEIDAGDLRVKDLFYRKTADSDSEAWVQRFREDLQQGMDGRIW